MVVRGSISRVLYCLDSDDHSSGNVVTNALKRHTRTAVIRLTIMPFLFGLAPDGVYLARFVAVAAVRSYRTLSALPLCLANKITQAVFSLWHFPLKVFVKKPIAGRYPAS